MPNGVFPGGPPAGEKTKGKRREELPSGRLRQKRVEGLMPRRPAVGKFISIGVIRRRPSGDMKLRSTCVDSRGISTPSLALMGRSTAFTLAKRFVWQPIVAIAYEPRSLGSILRLLISAQRQTPISLDYTSFHIASPFRCGSLLTKPRISRLASSSEASEGTKKLRPHKINALCWLSFVGIASLPLRT